MAHYHSKFSNKKHSVGGIMATILGTGAVSLFVAAIVESCKARGEAGPFIGSLSMLALAMSFFGLIAGLLSYRELDRYTTFSFIGSFLCGIMTILLTMLIFVGIG